ncbi:unnamed protein product [Rhodiola kirilowii]
MSGDSNTEEVLVEGVGGPNGDGVLVMGLEGHVNEDLNSGGEAQFEESPFDGSGDKEGAAAGATDDSSDQDSSYVQVDRVETSNDSVHTDSDDMKITDDAGKEDMFVDAPDELGASAPATDSEETTERSVEGTRFYEEGGMQAYQFVDEVEHLRSTLVKVIAENNALYREKEEERVSSLREIADIRHRIKALSDQNTLVGELDGVSTENVHEEEETGDSEIPLSNHIRECSESLKRALEDRAQSEGKIRELHETLNSKENEISNLSAKISQMSLSLSQKSQEVLSQAQNQNYQYADAVLTQLLASLSAVVYQGELVDESIAAKASMVESGVSVLIQNFNEILYDIEQLRQVLNLGADTGRQMDFRTILSATRDELLALRAKQEELLEKFNQTESENKGLLEKLQTEKEAAVNLNAEVAKTKMELDQEKAKSGTLREKLSLAVTKGKGLVQQRDSLRQSLAEKTREFEDCLAQLQDISLALEASELKIVDLVAIENTVTSLQESLSLKDGILMHIEEILSQGNLPNNIQFQDLPEKVKWLVDDRITLTEASLELNRVEDAMSKFDFPETVTSLNVVSRISWLKESSHLADCDIIKLQEELAKMKEAANTEIHRLFTSLSDVIQENDFMKTELSDLSGKLEGIVQKERHLLQEREDAVKMLLDASGITLDKQEEFGYSSTNLPILVEKCLSRTVEQNSRSVESSLAKTEDFGSKITMLYVKDLELTLCLQLLEEDNLERSQVKKLMDEIKLTSERLAELKEERDSLHKDLSRAEEKVSTLREKLSMAVKKGKGLVQERENMKGHLDGKNQEIEKLKREIQQLESQLSDYSNKISNISIDLERIPQLEAEIVSIKDQRDQLEKFLEKKEKRLQVVIECIQSITLPTGLVFDDPVDKLNMIGSYMSESEASKVDSEKELEQAKQEASDLDTKLVEAHSIIKSLEDAVFDKENNLSQITAEKNELESGKALIEQKLQRLTEETQDQSTKLSEVSATVKSLQDALSQAESDLHVLSLEKEEANAGKVAAEMELEKAQEEVATQSSKLTEAFTTIRTLEDKLFQMEANLSLLAKQNDQRQEGKSVLEIELQKLKDEMNYSAEELVNAHSTIKLLEDAVSETEAHISALADEKKIADEEKLAMSSKLAEAYETIKAHENTITQLEARISTLIEENSEEQTRKSSLEVEVQKLTEEISSLNADLANARTTMKLLEDAASDAKTNMADLVDEKKTAEAMVSELQTKLNACLEELSGTHGNIQNRYMDLISLLKDLHMLATNDTLASWKRRYRRPLENLKSMDSVLEDIRYHFVDIGHPAQPSLENSVTESSITEFLTDVPTNIVHTTTHKSGLTLEQVDEVNKLFIEVADRLHQKERYISENVEGFCNVLDTLTEAVLQKLQLSKNEIVGLVDHISSLKKTVENLELGTAEREKTIATLEKDMRTLAFVSVEAEKHFLELCSAPELEFASHDLSSEAMEAESDSTAGNETFVTNRFVEIAKNLSQATKKVHNLIIQLLDSKKVATATISDLQNESTVARSSIDELRQERDLTLSRFSKLEADLQTSKSRCDEMSLKIENHQANEEILMKKEADVSLLYNNLLSKVQETKDSHLSTSQLRALLDKASGVDFPFEEPEDFDPHSPTLVKKLGFIMDNFSELQHQLVLLSRDKQELQSTIGQQQSEIQQLQEEILEHAKNNQRSQKTKNEISEFVLHLERVILKLGGTDASEDQTPEDARKLLSVLDKLIGNLVLEYENSKSDVRQLKAKLLESQKAVDSLSMKAQSREELIQHQTSVPQTVQERSFVVPSTSATSEITKVEDVDLSGKSTITPVPSAAQMRTFRKGSTDHLALNIDTESAPLISNVGTDEDKGHVFKSLNTTGLIPKQGKLFADRIDGIWVNGGRVLMNQPRARLGVMAYWLVLHIWLLATIL